MVLHIYVGFKTITDAVQDVTLLVLFCFILYVFSGILYIAVGVKYFNICTKFNLIVLCI